MAFTMFGAALPGIELVKLWDSQQQPLIHWMIRGLSCVLNTWTS